MTETMTTSLVHQYAAMKPTEFGKSIEPKWQVAGKLVCLVFGHAHGTETAGILGKF